MVRLIGRAQVSQVGEGGDRNGVGLGPRNACVTLLSDILLRTIATFPLDAGEIARTQRAYQKLLWVQSDFIARHYQATPSTKSAQEQV